MQYKKHLIIALIIIALGRGLVFTVNRFFGDNSEKNSPANDSNMEEKKKYEVLVSVRDEMNPDPEEDKKSSMKKGYVIGAYNEGQKWSDTEKISYLILKMDLTEEQKAMLKKSIERNMGDGQNTEVIGMREYRINLEKIGFSDPDILLKGQPFKDKIFSWEVVKKIE